MDRSRYPEDWERIVAAIRARAGDRCECEGECGHTPPIGDLHADAAGTLVLDLRCTARQGELHHATGSRVVLTTAHMWRGPCAEHHAAGIKCGDPEHLKSMCQMCHLAYDLPQHIARGRATRRARRATGDLFD